MRAGLVLVVSLFLVVVVSCAEDQHKEDQLKPVDSLASEATVKRASREAKKQTNDKKKIKAQGIKRRKNKPKRQRKSKKKGVKGTGQQKGKKDNNETKKKRKSKTKTGEFKKFKLAGRKKKTIKKTSLTSNPRQCQTGIGPACMEAAKNVLVYEGNQVINFLKKFLRYSRQANVTGNKLGKKGAFSTPKKHMEDAMGGNMTTLTGCPTETSRGNYSSNYAFLSNCSALIDDKCTPVKPEEAQMTAMEKCNTEMTKIRSSTENCRKFETDGAQQCTCWLKLESEVNGIKALQPKCIQTIDKMGKDMKKAATTCTNTFSLCKKAEDASLKHINDCMNFETQNLNYTQIHANADIDGF
eukprot:TRINITY_DN33997_c0_g1_i1.p1 TRINITY_DN33997_c0_g1~~TRINITY_DN33997_c0_g1_i1.p1  ORF type:complete len:355 (-),score=87.36 TRINITY_DN33997_c0_g1_i1:66-1130(-)